ncbi:MAG: sulfatase-like hydrolase/transferase [Halobacteriaceae archaeon]
MPDGSPDRPNVVFVLCDQMRGGAMSCAGDPNVETPTLDRLADRGTRFENAHATYPVCVPSRFTLWTGRYAHTRNVSAIGYRLSPAEETLADRFGAAGYRTALVGKWHLYDARHGTDPVPPSHRGGFDYWRGFDLNNAPFDSVYYADDDPEPRAMDGHQTDAIFDLGREFLDDHADRDEPFFLTLSAEAPHPPFRAPAEFVEPWTDRALEMPDNVPYPEGQPPGAMRERWGSPESATADITGADAPYLRPALFDDMRVWYAMIEHLDAALGSFLEDLAARGLREDTVVVFLSDHGEMMGAHGLNAKQWPYRESTRVPFVVDVPGDEGGRAVSTPTCSEDWFPTLLGLAGVDVPADRPGANLAPVCRGGPPPDRDGVLLQFCRERRNSEWAPFRRQTWRAFVTESYRYAVKGGDDGAEPWQLFDLEADPGETENLVADPDRADAARRLHGRLRDRLVAVEDDFPLAPALGHDGCNLGPGG